MDPVAAQSLPNSGSLVRVLGFGGDLDVEETKMSLRDGDRWVVCSDGLYRMLSDRELRRALASGDTEECVWGPAGEGTEQGRLGQRHSSAG